MNHSNLLPSRVQFAGAWSPPLQYGATLLFVAAITGIAAIFNSGSGFLAPATIENPGTLYILPVAAAAVLFGLGPALVALVASLGCITAFFHAQENGQRLILLLITILLIVALAERQRRIREGAERAQGNLRAILESMSDAVMVVDAAGHPVDVNAAATTALGAPDRRTALDWITQRDSEGVPRTDEYALLLRALAGERAVRRNVALPDTGDGPGVLSAVANPVYDTNGRVIGAVSVSRNVTAEIAREREREQLLREIEGERQFTRRILDVAPIGIGVIRPDDLAILTVNASYASYVTQFAAAKFVPGTPLTTYLPGAEHTPFVASLRTAVAENRIIRETGYGSDADTDHFFDWTAQPLPLSDDTVAALITFEDTTARVRGERERENLLHLVEDRRRFAQTIFDAVPVGLAVLDAATMRYVAVNPAFLAPLPKPYHAGGLNGARLSVALPGRGEEAFLAMVRAASAGGEERRRATPYYHAERGVTYWDETLVPLVAPNPGDEYVLYVCNEVTEQVLAQEQIALLAAREAERGQQLEAVFTAQTEGLLVIDLQGRVVRYNAAAEEIAVADGTPLTTIAAICEQFALRDEGGEPVRGLNDDAFTRLRDARSVEAIRQFRDGRGDERWMRMNVSAVRDAAGDVVGAVVAVRDITGERREAEERARLARELAERQRFAEAIFASVPVGLMVVGAEDGRVRAANDAYARFLDTTLAGNNLVGKAAALLQPAGATRPLPEDAEEQYRAWSRTLTETRQPVTIRELAYPDYPERGETFWDITGVPLMGDDDTVRDVLIVAVDVTDATLNRRRVEELAQAAGQRAGELEAIFASMPDGIAITSATGAILQFNAAARILLGMDAPLHQFPTEVADYYAIRLSDGRVAAPDDLPTARAARGDAFSGYEIVIRTPRGDRILSCSGAPIRDANGAVTGGIVVFSDVTERVESRQRIEELAWDAAQRAGELETVIASIADGVMVADAAGRITLDNTAARRLLGRTASLVMTDPAARLEELQLRNARMTPVTLEELPTVRALHGEIVTDQVLIVRRADTAADRYLLFSGAPVRGTDGAITGTVAVFRDITALKEVEQMKDEFISIAAHELRTPLTAIKGYAELLDRRLTAHGDRARDRHAVGIIYKQAERLANLVNEMLDVSRIEAGRLHLNREPIDIGALVAEAVNNLRVSDATHTFAVEIEPGIEVEADAARIEQVLINLIANAVTYSPEGGAITARARAVDGHAVVSIADQGIGIAPDDVPHLFDRFYRASNAGVARSGGMGLGLYICREIIERHGGTIRAESTADVGSTFTLTLPLAGTPPPAPPH